MTRTRLTREDVDRLLADPSGATRAATAAKIAHDFESPELTESERQLALQIFRLMVKDAEVRVREALAQNLRHNPAIPRDVALALARDVDSVALPVIECSGVLTDDDLLAIVRSQGPRRQVAVARRPVVSEAVSEALVEEGNEEAVTALVGNPGAAIGEPALHQIVDRYGERAAIQTAMVHRPTLPVTVAERLVTLVSESLKEELAKRHELPAALATDLILQSRERATITLTAESDADELARLIRQLGAHGRLTPSIILRALCMGDLRFFESAIAELAAIPLVNVRTLIHDSGKLGLRAVFDKAGLPPHHFPAVRAAIDVARETDYDGGENDRERYARRMIERILTQYGDLGVDFDGDDLEYLLAKMSRLPHDILGAS